MDQSVDAGMNAMIIKAIPTRYAGVNFRSRLEAKWAAFFDLCGWRWSYEPVDFNGWIPDFAIGERNTLVEVKPFFKEAEWTETAKQVRKSGCNQNVILLGADPCHKTDPFSEEGPAIGYLLQDYDGVLWDLNFGQTEGADWKWGLCPMEGAWTNYIWDLKDLGNKANRVWRDNNFGTREDEASEFLRSAWAEAQNKTQWRSVVPPIRGLTQLSRLSQLSRVRGSIYDSGLTLEDIIKGKVYK